METNTTELIPEEMEKAAGCGLITKPFNPFSIPGLKPKKTRPADEQESNQICNHSSGINSMSH